MTQNELQHWLGQQGYDLMNEEQWEYVVGAGTRRLFLLGQ